MDVKDDQLEQLDETLVKILNDANYPLTEAAAALMVSKGVSNLKELGVHRSDIASLLLSLLED